MFNELVLQINPTITAIATLLILFSLATGGLVLWLTRGKGVMPGEAGRV
jgi:putative spermidine/putrescine transport system permease protein